MRRWLIFAFGILVLLAWPGTASAVPPPYEGILDFPSIAGPEGPEEFSWTVSLGPGQSLEPVDDQHVEIYYEHEHHPAFGIEARPAHDAEGATVPTTLAVSEGDVVTLIVHHRAGNPAAGGASFVYPIVDGMGWEGGFKTEIVTGPKDEKELREERETAAREEREKRLREEREADLGRVESRRCVVPSLRGQSVATSRRELRGAHCRLGKVSHRDGGSAGPIKVVKQSRAPGADLAPDSIITVTVGG